MPHPPLQGFTEAITRHIARGWVRDPATPERRVLVQALAHGRVIAQAPADLFRGDVRDAGLGDGNCGFVLDLSAEAATLGGAAVTLCDAATGAIVQGSPASATDPPSLGRFLTRWDDVAPRSLARLRRMMRHRTRGQGVSVIACSGADVPGLRAALKAQLCNRWELLAAQDGTDPFAACRYPLALIVTGRVTLERDAIWHLLRAAADPRPAVFLWDFARRHATGAVDLICRPAFSPDGFCSHPDPGGAFAVRTTTPWAIPTELILRLSESHSVAQIPRVLHRTADPSAPPTAADRAAVQRHLARRAPGARATRTADGITVAFPPAAGRTLAVIPTRNQAGLLRSCLESLLRTRGDTPLDIVVIDHQSDDAEAQAYLRGIAGLVTVMPYEGTFDFAGMNNRAVARHGDGAETLLFLNNDTEAITPGWLARMRSLAIRADVGAVGALLLYGDNRVQHSGVVLGFDGTATHAHTLVPAFRADGSRNPGYDGQLTALREVSAVTAACMMMRREVFSGIGGFDENLPIGFNDTDLCLRLRADGWRILQDGQTVLYHHESRTRRLSGQVLHPPDTAWFKARHAALIRAGDKFYNPNLRLEVRDHELRWDCLPGGAARLTCPWVPAGPGAAPAAAATSASAAPRRRRSSG